MPQTKRKRDALKFADESCKKLFHENTSRVATPQTWYKLDTIDSNGFNSVCEALRFQGWDFFCSLEFGKKAAGFDVEIVRQFYANLKTDPSDEGKLTSMVNNKKICFSPKELSDFIASLRGEEQEKLDTGLKLKFRDNDDFEHFDRTKDTAPLLDPEFAETIKPAASQLTVFNRLLAHIIFNCIVPKSGSRTYIPNSILALLHYLNTKQKVNLGILLTDHMLFIHTHPTQSLPHATFITYWLKAKWNIKPQIIETRYICFDNIALNHMFKFNKETGVWTSKSKSNISASSSAPSVDTLSVPNMSDPSMDAASDPSMASSACKPSSSSLPVQPYTPTAPGYTPFGQNPSPSPNPSPSVPLSDSLINELIGKMDSLQLHSPSIDLFNSTSQQLVSLMNEHQTGSFRAMLKIEKAVEKFDDQMKGYGHHSYCCMLNILEEQNRMNDEQVRMNGTLTALLNILREIRKESPAEVREWQQYQARKNVKKGVIIKEDGK